MLIHINIAKHKDILKPKIIKKKVLSKIHSTHKVKSITLGIEMDKKIKKIQAENKKEGKELSSLLKADKKQDKKIEKCDMKIKHKKK